jgi:predicted acyltransferase
VPPLERRILELFKNGCLLVVLGYVWGLVFPINKPIWTSSYAVFTAGQATCALALCLYACDLRGFVRWARPFQVYGVNAITVFVGSGLVGRLLVRIEVGDGAGGEVALKTWIHEHAFESWLQGENASLAYALTWIAGWYLVLRWMDRRGIRLKV